MLIEFTVENYKSFREPQTLSMVAAPRLGKKHNSFKTGVSSKDKVPSLLKTAAIYGPNASGKTSLLDAFWAVKRLVYYSVGNSRSLPVEPFRFDEALREEPSTFRVAFVSRSLRYSFIIVANRERIVHESLSAFPLGKETLIYDRTFSDNSYSYDFGALEGGDELHQVWRRLTGPQTCFMAQVVMSSDENLTQLRMPFEWFAEMRNLSHGEMERWATASQRLAKKNPAFAKQISDFLQRVDVPVTDIRFENIGPEGSNITSSSSTAGDKTEPVIRTTLTHRTALGEAEFDFSEESSGTRSLVGFWLPWSTMSDRSTQTGLLIVDELDSSLHPKIVESLIREHIEGDHRCQLIFTTHDTHLMNSKLLRRDQLWLTERDANGATQLRSIHDFEGRESEDVEKRYYEGRYRSLPLVIKA